MAAQTGVDIYVNLRGANEAAAQTNNLTNSLNKMNMALKVKNQLINNAIFMLTRYVGAFAALGIVKNITSTIIEFEKAMKQVQAISGATADEMERLTQVALKAGKIYTPKDVAELELILSKLGFTASEIGASTEAIVNLSIATGEDLATSAELAASIVRGFNLDISQTAKVTETLAAGLNSSALSLSNTREAIKYVAPIAEQLGWTFEEVTASLGKLSNAQISGSLAGTSMRNIMAELADKGSKLNKVLGNPKNFDEFVIGLQKINEEGVNLDNIFKLVPKRATSALAVLLANADGLRQYRDELDNTKGAIQNMVDIQMQSLSNQLKEMTSKWKSFVSSVDDGSGVISVSLKGLVGGVNALITALDALNRVGFGVFNPQRTIAQYAALKGMEEASLQKQKERAELQAEADKIYIDLIEKRAKDNSTTTDAEALKEQKSLIKEINKLTAEKTIDEEQLKTIPLLTVEYNNLNNQIKQNGITIDDYRRRVGLLSKLITGGGLDLGGAIGDKGLSRLREERQLAVDLLKSQKELLEEQMDLFAEGFDEKMVMAAIELKYSKLILDKQLEYDIEIAKAEAKSKEYILSIQEKYYNLRKAADLEYSNFLIDLDAETTNQIVEQKIKDDLDALEMLIDSIPNVLNVPDKYEFGLIYKLVHGDKDAQKKLIDDLYTTADLITDAFKDIADAQVDAIDRIVDRYDQMVEETQRQLEIETELFAAGYASNVTLKQQELDQLKAQRDVALKDQQEYVKMQQRLESTVQAINLASAVAGILKNLSVTNPFALIAAPGVIAALFKLWNDAKVKAIESSYQFGEGGWIDGQPHSKGGKWINAEGGEFVVNKQSSGKFAPLLEAINTGRKIPLDLMLDRNLIKDLDRKQHGLEMMQHRVTFDDGKAYKELKTIRELLSDKGGTEYRNGYRIERTGIRTRKIYDN